MKNLVGLLRKFQSFGLLIAVLGMAAWWMTACGHKNPTFPGPNTATPTPVLGTTTPTVSPTPTNGAMVTTLAGQADVYGATNATGTAASFYYPAGVAVDSSGNVYVADSYNNQIRIISPAGVVTTLAGSGLIGSANGTATAATFHYPWGVAVDNSGNVYVADINNQKIRKITAGGVVTTFAGSGSVGSANGIGTAATFNAPGDVALDSSGNLYVADTGNNMIRKITPAGVVTTLAGQLNYGAVNGTGTAASFNYPAGVAVDHSGNVYVADLSNNLIRKITSAGVVSTLAGGGPGSGIQEGATNGTGTAASFDAPCRVTVDSSGNLYVSDSINYLIRKITPAGVVSTLAGSGFSGSINGKATVASFSGPAGVAVDSSGNVYVADRDNDLIRKIIP